MINENVKSESELQTDESVGGKEKRGTEVTETNNYHHLQEKLDFSLHRVQGFG